MQPYELDTIKNWMEAICIRLDKIIKQNEELAKEIEEENKANEENEND